MRNPRKNRGDDLNVMPIVSTPAQTVAALEARGTMQWTGDAGKRIAWHWWGEGPALLLLHGGSGSWTHWFRNIPDLARDHRVIVPDLPGSGDSDYDSSLTTTEIVAQRVARHLPDILGDADVSIVGFSFGSMVGGYLARDLPQQVKALVLVGAVGMGLRRDPVPMQSWRTLTNESARLAAHRANLAALMLHDPARIDDLTLYLQQSNAERTRLRTRRLPRDNNPLAEALTDTRVPLAGIWGEQDVTAAPYLDDRRTFLQALRPHVPFHLIPGIGHWVQFEGADAFNATLRDVLKELLPVQNKMTAERTHG
jgi:pimeloyl-ACP methyl ester carboxylesterase